jgi:uncharacterized surface protein with fasciclin (FAS1) repeats
VKAASITLVRPPTNDVLSLLTSTTRFRTFVTVLVATQLIDDLRGTGPYVVLAPTDEAFDALPSGTLSRLMLRANVESLVDLAENHIATHGLSQSGSVRTLLGTSLRVTANTVSPFGVRIVDRWRESNGVVVAIDHVLLPNKP